MHLGNTRQSLNHLTLLLRFGNIFYLVCAPLLRGKNPSILTATPLVGAGGFVVLSFLLLSDRASHGIIRLSPILDAVAGVLLVAALGFGAGFDDIRVHYLLAVSLGAGLAATEAAGLRVAIEGNQSTAQMRSNLALFNGLKVLGIALGFFLAGLIAETSGSATVARVAVGAAGCALVVLAIVVGRTLWNAPEVADRKVPDTATPAARWNRLGIGLTFVVVDLAVFNFWYAHIPARLTGSYGYSAGLVGFFMAVQAVVHSFSQSLWNRILHRIGEVSGYALSQALHVTAVFVIADTTRFSTPTFLVLFALMGLVNSGTYLASATILYSAGWPTSYFRRIGIHQIASNFGKFLGTSVTSALLRFH